MTDTTSLLRLMSWLSPVFPTGGFAYSAGLEQAVANGAVSDADDLQSWIAVQLTHGNLWNDSVFFAEAHRRTLLTIRLDEIVEFALALNTSCERLAETISQATSFNEAALHWIGAENMPPRGTPLPICVGHAAGVEHLPLELSLSAYLHAFVSNQLQCGIRLSVIGQSGAARLLAALEPVVAETASRASQSGLDDLGTCAIIADIASMNHETLQPRLFLS